MAQSALRRVTSNLMLGATAGYVVAVGGAMLWLRVAPTPDFLVVALAPALFFAHRFGSWIRDWAPFVVAFLLWDGLRALAGHVATSRVSPGGLVVDRALFGDPVPPVALQHAAAAVHLAGAADLLATVADLGHFPGIFALALVVWLKNRPAFTLYAEALFATAFTALVVFMIWPTAPPWFAAEQGDLAGLRHVMNEVMTVRWSGFYDSLDPNRFAALPSLHAALPLLGFLALRRLRSRLAWVALAWTLLVWVSIVYLGEQYVADVPAGAGLAGAWWVAVTHRRSVLVTLRAWRTRAAPQPGLGRTSTS